MKLFKKRREREEKSNKTKELIKDLFVNNVLDNQDYKLIYAYKSFLDSKNNQGYLYDSFIIGYREKDMSLIVLNVNKEINKVLKNTKYVKGKIEKASYSKTQDLYTIYKTNKKSFISFTPIIKNYNDEDILAIINQEEEIVDFKEFFYEFKKKPRVNKK